MNSKLKGGLCSPQIKDKQCQLVKSSSVIQTYIQMILQQPDLKLDALPSLPDHQKTARKHSKNWNLKVLPLMAKTDADLIDFANKFDAFYDDLVKYAKELHIPQSKRKLVEGLQLLEETVKEKDNNVLDVVRELTAFQSNLSSDFQNFLSDVNTADAKILGDSGELSTLKKEIEADNDALDKDIGLMAGGAVAIALGTVLIIAGAFAEIPTCGGSTPLVVGGVVTLMSGAGMEIAGSVDFTKKVDQMKQLSEKLNDIQAELLGLQTTKMQVAGFMKALSSSITAATDLKAGWQALDADLQELIIAINDVHPGLTTDWLLDELKRAKLDWKEALEQAKRLQPDGKIPVKYYNDIKDAFKNLKEI